MSALGDIIQSFTVLETLKKRFPEAQIDWAVEKRFASIVEAHPHVHQTIAIERRFGGYVRAAGELRRVSYDLVFDLQGNCKSGLTTLLSKSRCKVGFGWKCVREWPNLLATNRRYDVPSNLNIRFQLLSLAEQALGNLELPSPSGGVRFKISAEERQKIESILKTAASGREKIMVCLGSKWKNKQLPLSTLASFLAKIDVSMKASFFLIWGNPEEKRSCEELQTRFPENSLVVDRLELPVWQNLMDEMDLIIAFDSGALHLAGTTSTPSFSIFGPTMPGIFKPLGSNHFSMRGECPYQRRFEKQCPLLRTCPTGACIRNLEADEIFSRFWAWQQSLTINDKTSHRK